MIEEAEIIALSDRQLRAYNARDIDEFCACYSDDIRVLDGEGTVTLEGMAAFRESYAKLFTVTSSMGAYIISRLTLGPHIVERERYHRSFPDGRRDEGEVIVRYTCSGGKIAIAQFLRA